MPMSAVVSILASAARTASGTGAAVRLPGVLGATDPSLASQDATKKDPKALLVMLSVTAGSGTVTTFRVWLEFSQDGASWYEQQADVVMESAAAAPGTAQPNQRDLVNKTAVQSSLKILARYSALMHYVRAQWAIAGTTPSETFAIDAVAVS